MTVCVHEKKIFIIIIKKKKPTQPPIPVFTIWIAQELSLLLYVHLLIFFETGSHHIALTVLKLTL